MILKDRAPIVVFVYNRPDKTKGLFESLSRNLLAVESDLFIFSDAAKTEKAVENVNKVREYIGSVKNTKSFRNVEIFVSKVNKGLAASVIEGVTQIINKYGKVIVLEDDLIVSEHFLTYMNECLDFYKDDPRIWSVSGYSHNPPRPENYKENVYLNYRASSWGWGTWLDRWELVDWTIADYNNFRFNPMENIRFCFGGNDLPSMLRAQMKGRIDSWAVRWCYSQTKHRMLSIAPMISLVGNDGLDGSGTNCRPDDENGYGDVVLDTTVRRWTSNDLRLNSQLTFDFYKRHRLSLYVRIRDKFRQLVRGRK